MFYHRSNCHPYMQFGNVHPTAAFWNSHHNDHDTDDDKDDAHTKSHLLEPKHSFVVKMDVPGVEAHHVTIEESNGELEIMAVRLDDQERVVKTYQDVMYIHPSKANFSDLAATLKDGVLTIRVPRRIPKVMTIEPEASAPPVELPSGKSRHQKSQDQDHDTEMLDDISNEDDSVFRVSMDLPGVSLDNLTVKVRDDTIYLFAKRRSLQRRCATSVYRHSWNVPPSIDMVEAKAYLHCGVFTLIAPCQETVPSVGVRTFYATPTTNDENDDDVNDEKAGEAEAEAEEKPLVANLNSENKSNKNDNREWDMVVDSTIPANKSADN